MRMVECEYCELQVKAHEKYQHEDQCGSRTDVCEKCQQYVMLKKMKEHTEHLCGKPVNTAPPLQLPPDEWAFEGFHPAEGGGAGAHVGGAVEPAELDQSWVDALNACREEGQSVDSIVAQNLAHENRVFRPVKNDTPSKCVYVCVFVCVCVCVCIRMCVDVCVHACVRMRVCGYILCMYVCVHMLY